MLYFFATPTTGTPYARLASLASDNPQFKLLYPMVQPDNYLATLQSGWLAADLGLKSYCAYETQPILGQTIVDLASATHLCNKPLDPIDANHIDIVKPKDQNSQSYRALKAAFLDSAPHSTPLHGSHAAPPKPSQPSAPSAPSLRPVFFDKDNLCFWLFNDGEVAATEPKFTIGLA